MILSKFLMQFCLIVTLCAASTQSINIQGTVTNNIGTGVAGANVKLELANISTITDSNGRFILTGTVGTIEKQKLHSTSINTIRFKNDQFEVSLLENSPVMINAYDVRGKNIFRYAKVFNAGTHVISSHSEATGLSLYEITIGNNAFTFKSSSLGMFSSNFQAITKVGERRSFSTQEMTIFSYRDIIFITKEGLLNYKDSIRTTTTNDIVVKMIPNAGNITDADGNVYQSVRIGNQFWTVENLKTTKFNDGSHIMYRGDLLSGYTFFENDSTNKPKYGALYNGYAATSGKLAPEGWRVPDTTDWNTLQNYLIANGYNWDGTTTGDKSAKSLAAQTGWKSDTMWAKEGTIGRDLSKNNTTGFSALPGGFADGQGYHLDFSMLGAVGGWWSSTEDGAFNAYGGCGINWCTESLGSDGRVSISKDGNWLSVRLLRN